MSPRLVEKSECMALIQERVWSREWHIILAPDVVGRQMASAIKDRFFKGKGEFFDLIIVPRPFDGCKLLGLSMAAKSVVSTKELVAFLDSPTSGNAEDGDILSVPTPAGLAACRWFAKKFTSIQRRPA